MPYQDIQNIRVGYLKNVVIYFKSDRSSQRDLHKINGRNLPILMQQAKTIGLTCHFNTSFIQIRLQMSFFTVVLVTKSNETIYNELQLWIEELNYLLRD